MTVTRASPVAGPHNASRIDRIALVLLATGLIVGAFLRREYLGDGVRHLTAVLSPSFHFGQARWVLFPPLARLCAAVFRELGLVNDAESALRAVLWPCVAAGVVFLFSLRVWLEAECGDAQRRAAALLLAGSCGPFLILYSNLAEPQIAAALAVFALAYARVRRDDPPHARGAAIVAVLGIGTAALIYQGTVLAFGMLPLVVSTRELKHRYVQGALAGVVLVAFAAMTATQMVEGMARGPAIATVVAGEENPLARSMMAHASPLKYAVALVAGPPQGIIALDRFGGLAALRAAVFSADWSIASTAVWNGCRLLFGLIVTGALVWTGLRRREWRVLVAAAVLLILPVLRNQQYGYPKFFVLWPIPVALLALRWRARTTVIVGSIVLATNGWLLARDIARGRQAHDAAVRAYASASPSTCWMTPGWSAPFHYLWPGTTTNMLGTLATGSDPLRQRSILTDSLRGCFCDADAVWTDATPSDAATVQLLAAHFHADALHLERFLVDPANSTASGRARIYSAAAQQRSCALAERLPVNSSK